MLDTASRDTRGFTLPELLTALAVFAILVTLGAPAFVQLVQSNRLTAATNDLLAGLHGARTEAIKQGRRVTLCKSANLRQCAAEGDWAQGWILFADLDRDAETDAGEQVLRAGAAAPNGVVAIGNGTVANYVSYGADASSMTTSGAFQAGRIRVCIASDAIQSNARDLVISFGGRVVVRQVACHGACPAPASDDGCSS